jgi:hexosaminidase
LSRGTLPLCVLVLAAVAVMSAQSRATEGTGAAPSFAAVIPKPLAAAPERGSFVVGPETSIVLRSGSQDVARIASLVAERLRAASGFAVPVVRATGTVADGSIVLALAPGDTSLGDEGYRLRVEHGGVAVTSRRPAGLFWAVQTMRQLLPPDVEDGSPRATPVRFPLGVVHDRPRFAWRGLMLDVARHFFDVAEVERLIDLMALYKLNRLHLHLTDDQGWRIAIRSWPRLTTHGGRSAVGGDGGGYYTQRQYSRIVAYARDRFVDVVPEIDMPGHVNAALSSYAKLTCDGKAPPLYTGIDVGFSSLCIRKELTYAFVDDVIREVAALTPGPYVHIGGDEALATQPADYRSFVRRVEGIVRSHGKRMIGWEDTARAVRRRTSIAQHWHDPELARSAVARGAKVIMSPATRVYLDMKYAPQTPIGLSWAGTTDVKDAYGWDPATRVDGVPETAVLGVEATLFSETTVTRADLDLLAFPRLLGVAEIGWSPTARRGWRDYRRRLAAQGPRLRALGVGYYADPSVPWR